MPLHLAVDAQAAGEDHVAADRGSGADQAVDALLRRRVLLAFEHGGLLSDQSCKVRVARGARLPDFVCANRHAP